MDALTYSFDLPQYSTLIIHEDDFKGTRMDSIGVIDPDNGI